MRNLYMFCGVIIVKLGECGNCDRNNCNFFFKFLVFLVDFLFFLLYWSLCNFLLIVRRLSL